MEETKFMLPWAAGAENDIDDPSVLSLLAFTTRPNHP